MENIETTEMKLEKYFLLKSELEDRENEFTEANKELIDEIEFLQAEIKEAVIKKADTIKTDHASAVYCKGRVTWDSKLLEGISHVYPAVADARKEGKPTVQIKLIRK